ncbi:UNVERIFIED_CONTAM: hypothetical protein H355_013822 [Colinus virginianus]|nr:hypothetical protein H355_013822 [Colinus virginianus]
MRAAVPSVPAVLCGSAALLLLLLRWRRWRGLWRKVKEARERQERGLEQMDKAVRAFRQQHPSVNMVSILSLSLPELSKKIQDGSLPPEHVFYAYVGKALQIARETNCITEYMQESETQLQRTKPKEKGLLYGVPVSIKDSINCQGHDSTLGFVKNIDKPLAEDSVLVQVLKRQGAIPFVKTNVPQSLISYDCNNLIFGQTCNPLLYTRTPGGSSGGEGALIGGVTAAVGPMAKDVESLALCMRALLCEDMFNLDSTVPPLPFNEEVYSSTQPLRIGYYETDFFTMPSPAMRRAVRETKQLLEEAGHTLVPFELTNVDYSTYNFCIRGMFADGGVSFLEKFEGELEKGSLGIFFWLAKSPNWLKTLLSWITKPFESCHQFIAQWKKLNLDVMLCPMLGPALRIGYPAKLSVAVSYTMLYNSLDFPVGVVPVTLATDEDEKELKNYQGYFQDWWDRTLATAFSSAEGMPVAVQCVALPWQEELCLRFMKEVETLVMKKNMIV